MDDVLVFLIKFSIFYIPLSTTYVCFKFLVSHFGGNERFQEYLLIEGVLLWVVGII